MRLLRAVAALALFAATVTSAADTCSDGNPWPYAGNNFLGVGQTLVPGQQLATKTATLSVQQDGNVVLTRKEDGKKVWQTGTSCAGASLTFTGDALTLKHTNAEEGSAPCWSQTLGGPSKIAALTDHCTFETFEQAPLTSNTWRSDMPQCIEAHIIPHSHDDVGWLLTPERYYDGCRTPGGGVKGILDTVVAQLLKDSNRTYNQVESYFFNRWWQEQDDETKANVKMLVNQGRFVFINGGWSMHDEACVHQESAISNMEVGARFIKETFGVDMNIGWHIDPFGHASATPRYMAEMGFDAFFFWRQDHEQQHFFNKTKQFENVWRNSHALGDKTLMFTSILYNNYCYGCVANTCPSNYYSYDCEYTDLTRSFQSQMADLFERRIPRGQTKIEHLEHKYGFRAQNGINVPTIAAVAEEYAEYIRLYDANFRTGIVMMPWGCDFKHEDASQDFAVMDSVIQYISDNYDKFGIKISYSTVPAYVAAVRERDYEWPVNEYDYFVYSDYAQAYWSGFFTSRAEFKGFERHLMNERSAADFVVSAVPPSTVGNFTDALERVEVMREAMGIAQHHDAITGTERTPVRNQYQFLMHRGHENINNVTSEIFANVTGITGAPPAACNLANLSYCPLTQPLKDGTNVSMYIFNPLAQARTEIITVPVPVQGVDAFLMPIHKALRAQAVSTWALTTTTDNTSPQPPYHQDFQLYVEVVLPPLTLTEVQLVPNANSESTKVQEALLATDAPTIIGNEHYELTFDPVTQRLSQVKNLDTGIASPADQNIGHYCPHGPPGQASGAYIFRTCEPHSPLQMYAMNFTSMVVAGSLCTEVRQKIDQGSNIQQHFRLCSGQAYVEMQTGLGELESLFSGVEVVISLKTDVANNGTWYTDSQALEMQPRVRNSRPNYPYTVTEPVSSNFFPCNAFTLMNSSSDPSKNIAVMADRSRATSSMNDGEFQFLAHRRLLYDDNRGVAEALNQITRVLTTSRVVFNTHDITTHMRLQSQHMTHKAIVRFAAPSGATSGFPRFTFPAANLLPPAIHLHTRTVHAPGELVLRLQHLFDVGEGPLAVPTTVDVTAVLPAGMKVTSVTDVDMNAVRDASGMSRAPFKVCDKGDLVTVPPVPIGGSSPLTNASSVTKITMYPMEIRVLRIMFEWQ